MEQTLGEKLAEAAMLIGVGMAVVFGALIILMVAIMIINRLAPERAKKVETPEVLEEVETGSVRRGRIAAMAVALAKTMEEEERVSSAQPAASPAGSAGEPSRWAVSGREQAMRSRGKVGRQWGRRSD
ncbi:MAG: OadG family protein [Dehalococcoidia bacterium]|nr:OadG family protein [Dehalococcoidia bacterium]